MNKNIREVHLIEPNADGHRMQYVRRILAAVPPDVPVRLSTFPGSREHPAFRQIRESVGDRLLVEWMEGETEFRASIEGKDGLSLQPSFWRLFRSHWRRCGRDASLAVVPYLDYCSYAIGLLGSPFGRSRFSGVVMRPDFHWAEMGVVAPASRQARLKKLLFKRLLANRFLANLVTIDPSLSAWAKRHRPAKSERLHYMQDPADLAGTGDRTAARAHFQLAPEARVVLMFGVIDQRKGLSRLLEVLREPELSDVVALIVGKQRGEAPMQIARSGLAPERFRIVDRYVNSQEEWLAFQACDQVWLAYDNFHGPSGVLAQAAQLGKPVVHNGQGLIGFALASSRRSPLCSTAPDLQLCMDPVIAHAETGFEALL